MTNIAATNESVTSITADAVVVGIYEGESLAGAAAEVDQATGGSLAKLIEQKEAKTSFGDTTTILAPSGVAAGSVVVVGLGKRDELDRGKTFRAAGSASRGLAGKERDRVAFFLSENWDADLTENAVAGAIVGCQGQDLYRAEKKTHPIKDIAWSGGSDDQIAAGKILGDSVNLTRRLVNEPPSEIYPESFASKAEAVGGDAGLEIEVWDDKKLAAENCGSMLGVAQGSSRPARLVIMRHNGGDAGAPTLALVGKGVTFDSGGLSLKPSDGMKDMKCDMAGAATVLGAMNAIARLNLPVNVVGYAGLVENMVSGDSYKLGDVLKSRNGKTIEVLNTDAEGRLVLADVLDIAIDQGADKLVDLATLTGACLVALGMDVAGLFTNDQAWCDAVKSAADTSGEQAWQLPMFKEYGEQIKSDVADIKNIGAGRWGGAITAAKFLEEFVQEKPWVHIDIAGPSFLDKPKSWVDGGGSGAFVRTLVELAKSWK